MSDSEICWLVTSRDYIGAEEAETFIKRYIVERTNKTEIRPEEQSEKTESCRGNLGIKQS